VLLDNLADVVEASNSTAGAVDGDDVAPAKTNRGRRLSWPRVFTRAALWWDRVRIVPNVWVELRETLLTCTTASKLTDRQSSGV
jgi:hypothetical protein